MRDWKKKLKYLMISAAALVFAAAGKPQSTEVQAAQKGIDVSQWQGTINWGAVRNSGISFAMIRCGNIKYGMDASFPFNMTAANAAGIRTGVYCYTYALNPAQAMQDAQFVVAACQNFTVSFPIAVDFEDKTQVGLSPQQQAEIVNAFCAVIYNAGYTPMVYTSRNWFVERMGPVSWDHWVAQYNSVCDYPGAYAMWQYTSSGLVPGINGRVDMNYLYKDYFTLIKQNGFDTRNGNTYYYQNYKRVVGLQNIESRLYFFDGTGAMQTGWLGAGPAKYYFDPSDGGAAVFGWKTIDGFHYYFGANGFASVGLTAVDGANYLFDGEGRMTTGWVSAAGATLYFAEDGRQALGLTQIDGSSYYFNTDGAMVAGLFTLPDGMTRFFGADGRMAVGWQEIGGGWFFFGEDGVLVRDAIFNDNAGIGVQVDANGLLVAPLGYVPQ
ncbi:glycoside hydrolase family 25 protein [Lachnoclostridium sp. Marseille-P6806]|uniref:glycoside hydrolase family 25 protein n=1 Tax=Lachnoclostridium sp. Marseille-P6806 TaxID=2364793 RepID=UPI0013EF2F50|nr:glycoside hydrolase family 25 protein [Lachnoclostridium sp. Marseille-P6806]